MKRWIGLLAGFALAVLLAPSGETEIADLRPVELLSVYQEEGQLCVETDTGDLGKGVDLQTALKDLKATTPGEIFLETADYVMVTAETKAYLPELKKILRPATEIVQMQDRIEVSAAAEFLSVHRPGLSMKDYRSESMLPMLAIKEGRCSLVQ